MSMNTEHDDSADQDEIVKHSEGSVARTIENQTARVPSDVFLWSAIAAGGVAIYCFASGRTRAGIGVAQLAPALLIMGLYNKIVKVAGSDRLDQQRAQAGGRQALLH